MRTATTIVILGFVLLFLGSLLVGPKVFSPEERSLSQPAPVNQADSASPDAAEAARNRAEMRKLRLAMSSFDLTAGLFSWELENIATNSRTLSFFFMISSLWLIVGLRRSRRG